MPLYVDVSICTYIYIYIYLHRDLQSTANQEGKPGSREAKAKTKKIPNKSEKYLSKYRIPSPNTQPPSTEARLLVPVDLVFVGDRLQGFQAKIFLQESFRVSGSSSILSLSHRYSKHQTWSSSILNPFCNRLSTSPAKPLNILNP